MCPFSGASERVENRVVAVTLPSEPLALSLLPRHSTALPSLSAPSVLCGRGLTLWAPAKHTHKGGPALCPSASRGPEVRGYWREAARAPACRRARPVGAHQEVARQPFPSVHALGAPGLGECESPGSAATPMPTLTHPLPSPPTAFPPSSPPLAQPTMNDDGTPTAGVAVDIMGLSCL